ncbi:MAG: YggT family protein [Magnetococcales bacterium]|nr:YggT family protein [Magnetococcales bacterium]MBF0149013.1 YggT family protein [Magnetococcales bacterium]MBF0172062.1 YggT family protein [Magnetococcales bacterium]MBF0346175.1 YggT family protein [Magnetococcales bacterium]MBF0630333.1 YggT family protein [Magnetococcales bacterium]
MGLSGSLAILLDFILGIYTWLILIRVLLSWVNPDPYNPIVQFLIQATEPVMGPFRRLIPPIAGLDLSPIAALLAIQLVQRLVVGLLRGGMGGGALMGFLGELLAFTHLLLTLYMLLLCVRAGFHFHAWYTFKKRRPMGLNLRHPLTRFVFQVTEPAIKPLKNWVPTVSGLDITPMVAVLFVLLALSLLQQLVMGLTMANIGSGGLPLPHSTPMM